MDLPRVSIFNCVSHAYEMLRFSSDAIINNAGYNNFDYIVVTWGPTQEVEDYLSELQKVHNNVHVVEYKTNPDVAYVPNLRGMMNRGFEEGFKLNDYCGLTNTDQYFGKDWLLNLVRYANEKDIVSSTHISPWGGINQEKSNFGVPEYSKFDMEGFNKMYAELYDDVLQTQEERGGPWQTCVTMPYLIPKKFWKLAGPWELTLEGKKDSPDVRFFQRCSDAGAHFTMSRSSIVYHHDSVERKSGKRPEEAKNMREE
jgi:hypothetical protein